MFDSDFPPKLKAFLQADKRKIDAAVDYRAALTEFWNDSAEENRERLRRTERNYLKERDAAERALHAWKAEQRAKK